MNEIALYTPIDGNIAANFIQNLGWMQDGETYVVRIYTPGGDPQAAWGMWAKMNELKNHKNCRSIAKIDGMACSTGGFLLCAFDEREALETSQIMIHRAVYCEKFDEKGRPIPDSPEESTQLAIINANFKSRLAQIIDNKELKKLKGYGLDEIFNANEDRINCFLTPKEALQIGLITKIVPIDAASSDTMSKAVAAFYTNKATAAKAGTTKSYKDMTAEELKKENPEAAAELEKEAVKAYKAKMKAKAKAAKASDKDPDDDDDEDEMEAEIDTEQQEPDKPGVKAMTIKQIDALVERRLQALGLSKVEGQSVTQFAVNQAKLAAKQAEEQKIKSEETKNALASLDKELESITTGKIIK